MISSVMSATIGQLLRSGQRDEQYLKELNNELNEIIQNWFGVRHWIHIKQHLDSLSQLIYYSVTTLSGLQTLGEEYVNIVQIDGNKLLVPKLIKRVLAIVLQTFTPFMVSRLMSAIRSRLENREIVFISSERRDQLLKLMPIIEQSFDLFYRIHLILFYLNGNYYYLSKRLTNIAYISLNTSMSSQTAERTRTLYKTLGYLTLSQLCISLLFKFYSMNNSELNSRDKRFESNISQSSVKSSEVDISHKCSLCLEVRRNTTATTCGHLFCWYCIAEWLQLKSECPLCREPLLASRIVLLNNYP